MGRKLNALTSLIWRQRNGGANHPGSASSQAAFGNGPGIDPAAIRSRSRARQARRRNLRFAEPVPVRLAPLAGCIFFLANAGGIPSLDHRLIAAKPPAWRSQRSDSKPAYCCQEPRAIPRGMPAISRGSRPQADNPGSSPQTMATPAGWQRRYLVYQIPGYG